MDSCRKTTILPAGILNPPWPRPRSMVIASRTKKTALDAIGMFKNTAVDKIGKILIRALKSSTCCTVHRFHGFATEPSALVSLISFRAAGFRNLYNGKPTFQFFVIEHYTFPLCLETENNLISCLSFFDGISLTIFEASSVDSW